MDKKCELCNEIEFVIKKLSAASIISLAMQDNDKLDIKEHKSKRKDSDIEGFGD